MSTRRNGAASAAGKPAPPSNGVARGHASHQGGGLLLLILLCMVVLPGRGHAQDGGRRASPSPRHVLLLKDGQEMLGTVLNESFRIQTHYGQFEFPKEAVASVILDPAGKGLEGLTLRNGDRLSGFVLLDGIRFREVSGVHVQLRKEKARSLGLGLQDPRLRAGKHVVYLRNGDVLTGRLRGRRLQVSTRYGVVTADVADLVRLEAEGDVETRVRLALSDGKIIRGKLVSEDVALTLVSGARVILYEGGIQRIDFRPLGAGHFGMAVRPVPKGGERRRTAPMVRVPAGEFLMGGGPGSPVRRVYVAAFEIDAHEVTNQDYLAFVKATGARAPRHFQGGRFPPGTGRHPVTDVSHEEAEAYAQWAGKRLPTEEEWEKAARGTSGFTYPWGSGWRPGLCNTKEAGVGHPLPVGRFPQGASPYGCVDMAGNVWEWTASRGHRKGSYVFKGGSWKETRESASTWHGVSFPSSLRTDDLGFRCARTPASDSNSKRGESNRERAVR